MRTGITKSATPLSFASGAPRRRTAPVDGFGSESATCCVAVRREGFRTDFSSLTHVFLESSCLQITFGHSEKMTALELKAEADHRFTERLGHLCEDRIPTPEQLKIADDERRQYLRENSEQKPQ